MSPPKYILHFLTLLGLIFSLTLIILAVNSISKSASADKTQQTEKKVYVFLKPMAELGQPPKVTISPPFFDEKTKLGKISMKVEPVGFWNSKKKLNDILYDLFEIPESSYTTEVGEPMISTINLEVEIPSDAKFKKALIKGILIRKFENVILAPKQQPLPITQPIAQKEEFIREKPRFTINKDVYNQTTPYPGEYYQIIADSFFGVQHIIILKLFPIQYYPAQKEIRLYSLEGDIIFSK